MIKNSRFSILLLLIVFIFSSGVYSTINYSEFFPNGSTVIQSQSNGWTTPVNSASKEIMTPEGCKRITSAQGQIMFIPTKTIAEWNSFKSGIPVGVTISECYSYTWFSGGWGGCSASCGGGNQSRTVNCQRSDNITVTDSYCTGTKPSINQSCNTQVCMYKCPPGYQWTGLSLDCYSLNSSPGPNQMCYIPGTSTIQCVIGPARIMNASSVARPILQ